jgi:cell division septum initiation protein DivIVA
MMAEAGLLREELRLLKRLLDLTHQIDHALQSEDLLSVRDLLDSRGKILARISRYSESARSLRSGPAKENKEGEISALIEEIKRVHEKIGGLDQKIRAHLESEKDGVYRRMLSARHGHRALQGYAPHRMSIPRYYDKKA